MRATEEARVVAEAFVAEEVCAAEEARAAEVWRLRCVRARAAEPDVCTVCGGGGSS